MNGNPPMVTWDSTRGEPTGTPERGSLGNLKATVAYGGMHLCRYGTCEVWVADGGDHRCVLHSDDAYAVAMREAFLAAHPTQHE